MNKYFWYRLRSSDVNPIVAKQIYMMSELCHRYQRIFSHQLDNFYTYEIAIYSSTFTEIFVQFPPFSWAIYKKTKVGVFIETLCISVAKHV